jgi:hypothetical protein
MEEEGLRIGPNTIWEQRYIFKPVIVFWGVDGNQISLVHIKQEEVDGVD